MRALPAGLWAEMVLAVTESHLPVLPVLPVPLEEGGEGEDSGEGLCWDTQWATAKPRRTHRHTDEVISSDV